MDCGTSLANRWIANSALRASSSNQMGQPMDTKICGTNAYILGSRNVLGMFPSLARNYERVFGIVTGSRDWRSKAQ